MLCCLFLAQQFLLLTYHSWISIETYEARSIGLKWLFLPSVWLWSGFWVGAAFFFVFELNDFKSMLTIKEGAFLVNITKLLSKCLSWLQTTVQHLRNKFSVHMWSRDILPRFLKRIAKEQAHILQKSQGPLWQLFWGWLKKELERTFLTRVTGEEPNKFTFFQRCVQSLYTRFARNYPRHLCVLRANFASFLFFLYE